MHLVATTIYGPDSSLAQFAVLPGLKLVVAGDRKTPVNWTLPNTTYLSPADQLRAGFSLAGALPWNHYVRKNLAYLEAVRQGAQGIIDTDDDNYPQGEFRFPNPHDPYDVAGQAGQWINLYRYFSDRNVWPRGIPLDQILPTRHQPVVRRTESHSRVAIWQSLADGDPDVDAVYRLTDGSEVIFDRRPPVVLAENAWSPYNSQATWHDPSVFALLYLPSTVTFRFTDILRSYVALPILAAAGLRLGFCAALVNQARNPHDYVEDFRSEFPIYDRAQETMACVSSVVRSGYSIEDNLARAYQSLAHAGIVGEAERYRVELWLEDLNRAARGVAQ